MTEADMQGLITPWLKSLFNLVHKISDVSPERKPFDCFAFNARPHTLFFNKAVHAVALELKHSNTSTIPHSEITSREHQLTALIKCDGRTTAGYYLFGYGDKKTSLRVFLVDPRAVENKIYPDGAQAPSRGAFSISWCEENGEEMDIKSYKSKKK